MLHHVMDLKPIIKDSRKLCVTLVKDNAPDQSIKSDKNVFGLGHLFKSCNLEALTAVHYAPGDSVVSTPAGSGGCGPVPCLPGKEKAPGCQHLS